MASFNPFSKAKIKPEKEENIEGIEEVEFMPADSVEYFEEAFQEKQAKEREFASTMREKQRALQAIGENLEAEKRKRHEKKVEIDRKIEVLKQNQREIAQNIASEKGNPEKLESELHKISVEILSEQAKTAVYEDEVKFYLPPNIQQDLKNRINEYDQAVQNYRVEKSNLDLLDEIREVIKSLKNLEEVILRSKGQEERFEKVETLIKPYLRYFISQEDLENIFRSGNQDLAENYLQHWIKEDSGQDFKEYARYLMSL